MVSSLTDELDKTQTVVTMTAETMVTSSAVKHDSRTVQLMTIMLCCAFGQECDAATRHRYNREAAQGLLRRFCSRLAAGLPVPARGLQGTFFSLDFCY